MSERVEKIRRDWGPLFSSKYFQYDGLTPVGQDVYDLLKGIDRLTAQLAEAWREIERLRNVAVKMNAEVCQTLAQALGRYPWYKDDQTNFPGATEADGVCVGEHVAESLALEAGREIERLRAALEMISKLPVFAHHATARDIAKAALTPSAEVLRHYGKKCAHDGYVVAGCRDCAAREATPPTPDAEGPRCDHTYIGRNECPHDGPTCGGPEPR